MTPLYLNGIGPKTLEHYRTSYRKNDTNAPPKEFGFTGSPLVADGKVVVSAGGPGKSMVAYDTASGELVWGEGGDGRAYSSPVLATLAGVPQVMILNPSSAVSHALDSGAILWSVDWPGQQPNVMNVTPVVGSRSVTSTLVAVSTPKFVMTTV